MCPQAFRLCVREMEKTVVRLRCCDQFDGPPDESQEDQTAEKNVCSRARAQESSEGSIALFRTGLLAIVFLSG